MFSVESRCMCSAYALPAVHGDITHRHTESGAVLHNGICPVVDLFINLLGTN